MDTSLRSTHHANDAFSTVSRTRPSSSTFTGLPLLDLHRSSIALTTTAPGSLLHPGIDASYHQDIQRPAALDSQGRRFSARPLPHRAYQSVSSLAVLDTSHQRHVTSANALEDKATADSNTEAALERPAKDPQELRKREDTAVQPTARAIPQARFQSAKISIHEKEDQGTAGNNAPQPPHHPIWGHLHLFGKLKQLYPSDLHPHWYPQLLKEEHNLGDLFYLDLWPAGDRSIVLCSGETAQQAINTTKHPNLGTFLPPLGVSYLSRGYHNLVSMEGKEWKKWRSVFNPGFAAAHLITLVPGIVDDAEVFFEILKDHATRQDIFRLEEAATRLTVDVIGKVTLSNHEFVDALRSSIRWLFEPQNYNIFTRYNPWRPVRHWLNTRIMDRYIGGVLDERFAQSATAKPTAEGKDRGRSVVSLAIETYNNESREDVAASASEKMDPDFRRYTIDQMKTFIFAGHDTTSSTICYVFHMLRKHPQALDKVRAEHDAIFGADPDMAAAVIRADPHLLNKLEYSNAVIREVLRLFPPASSVRNGEPGLDIFDPETNTSYPTKDCMVWILSAASHTNPSQWSDPAVFRPERFLGANAASLPKDTWRPFEKGPRSCIGRELSILETKVVMVLGLRRFSITTAYDEVDILRGDGLGWGRDFGGKHGFKGEEAYQILRATAKPRQGMPCRVSMRPDTRL
ncbi:MAG: hypothetical protein M1828_004604 [Chrysothrix sp. TS-e1954]|nr:MAG: hypothetical protein M1828_004604 [Chrysothrix sp. TS-e1954]